MNKRKPSELVFPPELRTMAVVPRWSVVWTLNKDHVSSHSWFVTMYAFEIAKLIEWEGSMTALMYLALTHDTDESVTGDIVSIVKSEILDNQRAQDYIDLKMNERLPNVMRHIEDIEASLADAEYEQSWRIIKAADRLDALLFLVTERRMGNGVIGSLVASAQAKLEAAWRDLPMNKDTLDDLWATRVMPSITAHDSIGGFGV